MSDNIDLKLLSGYSWLTEDLFKEIIEKDIENGPISVEEFIVKPALKHGENYMCQMIRVTLNYHVHEDKTDLKEFRFIVKAAHSNEEIKKMTAEYNIFDTEIAVYRKILTESERLLQSIGDYTKLAPRIFAESLKDMYIIFEDLTLQNYRNTNRRQGLNMNHCKRVLEKLAKYNATTAYLLSKNCPELDRFRSCPYNEDSEEARNFVNMCLKSVAEGIIRRKGFEYYGKKFEKIENTFFSKVCEAMQPDPSAFNVLKHGDLWANNIMFRSDENDDQSPTEALIVDFQLCSVGPAVLDLAYMFFTSSQEDLQDQDWDLLLQHYHEILKETLMKLEYTEKIPTLTDIHVQFLRKAHCMMIMGTVIQGMRRYEDANENTIEIFLKDNEQNHETRMKILSQPDIEKSLHFLLDYFDRKGLLEN